MRLEVGSFPVHEVEFGRQTRYRDGLLEIDRDEIVAMISRDPRFTSVELDLARPGESVRITRVRDAIEPRIKVEGPGRVYPGFAGRAVETVGSGRTFRLAGLSVTEVADVPRYPGAMGRDGVNVAWVDMTDEARRLYPLGGVRHVCLVMELDPGLTIPDKSDASHAAALQLQDTLASTVLGLTPPQIDVYEPEPVAGLPRIAHVACLHSPQHLSGSLTAFGAGIYGLTRQMQPWYLHPNEILDGAISVGTSWAHVNNPVLHGLLRRHGRELSLQGVIAVRTRWSQENEKELVAQQTAKLAARIGAEGVVITHDGYGNDFMEVIRIVRACESIGVKTVLMTGEEPPERGGPPVLEPAPEANAIVSLGVGAGTMPGREMSQLEAGVLALPAVQRVIGPSWVVGDPGTETGQLDVSGPLPGPRAPDPYGFGSRSVFTY